LFDDGVLQGNLGSLVLEAGQQFGHGVHLHETAVVASAVTGWTRDEGLVGQFAGQAMHHTALSQNNESIRGMIFSEVYHFFGTADFIR
tara:strand:- start:209 stop:472 length:264 start_codon:yes stop_codon:yes gene_type:complete